MESFKFLTRVHYYAADAVTYGPNSPWGEHEIDYILLIQVSHGANLPGRAKRSAPPIRVINVDGPCQCSSPI